MCLVINVCVFAAIFLLYPQKNDGLLYANGTNTKWPMEKTDLQILSLRSQPSEGSAAHPVILLADHATSLERSYHSFAKVKDGRSRYKLYHMLISTNY